MNNIFTSDERKVIIFIISLLIVGCILNTVVGKPKDSEEKKLGVSIFPIDINSANENMLKEIPGVGSKMAQKIVEYRKKKGKFNTFNDLLRVRGIGKKKLEKMRKFITLGGDYENK